MTEALAIDLPLFEQLMRTFFADVLDLFGGHATAGLDFGTLRFLDPAVLAGMPDPLTMEPAAVELIAGATRHQDKTDVLVHFQLALDEVEQAIQARTLRRYIQLRARFATSWVVPLVVMPGESISDPEVTLCEITEQHEDDCVLRFRYRTFLLRSNSAESYGGDPRPVAWALSALMNRWAWSPLAHKCRLMERILYADVEHDQRRLLYDFVDTHLSLPEDAEPRYREFMRSHAETMREVIVGYLDLRLDHDFPAEFRQRMVRSEDPMEIHQLMEDTHKLCLRDRIIERLPSERAN